MAVRLCLLLCLVVLFFVGCSNASSPPLQLKGTVEGVRIVIKGEQKQQDGHPIAGAVIGGALAGPLGIIAGGVIGNDIGSESQIIFYDKLACRLIVKAEDGVKVSFYFYPHEENALQCATLRMGDTLPLYKSGNEYSSTFVTIHGSKKVGTIWPE